MKRNSPHILAATALCILTLLCISCSGKKTREDGNKDTEKAEIDSTVVNITEKESAEEPTIVIVDDATGEVLGVKVNEVGDYFIINPGNEEIIPMQGHSQVELNN